MSASLEIARRFGENLVRAVSALASPRKSWGSAPRCIAPRSASWREGYALLGSTRWSSSRAH